MSASISKRERPCGSKAAAAAPFGVVAEIAAKYDCRCYSPRCTLMSHNTKLTNAKPRGPAHARPQKVNFLRATAAVPSLSPMASWIGNIHPRGPRSAASQSQSSSRASCCKKSRDGNSGAVCQKPNLIACRVAACIPSPHNWRVGGRSSSRRSKGAGRSVSSSNCDSARAEPLQPLNSPHCKCHLSNCLAC